MQIHYSLPEYEDKQTSMMEVSWIVDIKDRNVQPQVAVKCAEDFSKSIVGRSANWPLRVALHVTRNGKELARFSVGKRVEERFYAQKS